MPRDCRTKLILISRIDKELADAKALSVAEDDDVTLISATVG
jgi:hypothetical protein